MHLHQRIVELTIQMARSWRMILQEIEKVLKKTLRNEGEKNIEWMEDIRGNLAMVATVIATVTFQTGLNPPGGVVQSGDHGDVSCSKHLVSNDLQSGGIRGNYYQCPGVSVFADAAKREHQFNVFLIFNNLSFASSILACFFFVTGVPLRRPLSILLMSIDMCISLGSLGITYCLGVMMVEPQNNSFLKHLSVMIAVIFFFTIIVCFLLFNLFRTFGNYLKNSADATSATSHNLDHHEVHSV
ncbi:hypothetical protein PIB30_046682 [Stylosanthes scabra]|uniref:PGG domain-containing protein n=1 Tax=Stylosanthes scabra TaxID=79078 RepID=A0ABU6THC9_9FABA|nr:hypothetical protein [Stylosanthes scabra]